MKEVVNKTNNRSVALSDEGVHWLGRTEETIPCGAGDLVS
jgi:hypothetical protein